LAFVLVAGAIGPVGQTAQVRKIDAHVRRAVGADDPRAVDREHDREILQRHVVDQLIVAALQESRIDRDDGLHPLAREPGGKCHRVLLGDADIEVALREFLGKADEPRALAHRRRDCDEARIGRRHVAEPVAEDSGVGGFGGGLRRIADGRVEFGDAVIEDRGILGSSVTVALLRDHVQELRPLEQLHVGECLRQHVDVVPVDRTDIVEAEFLEQGAGQHHALHVLFHAPRAPSPAGA
jgi:hypothetical protein